MIKFWAKLFTILALSIVIIECIAIVVMMFVCNPIYTLFFIFTEIIIITAIVLNDKVHEKEECDWKK